MQILSKTNINFIRWRWHALAMSLVIIVAGIATIASRGGLLLGVDFEGGTLLRLKFDQPVGEDRVRRAVASMGDAVVQQFNNDPTWLMVRVPTPLGEQGTSLEATANQIKTLIEQAKIGNFTVENQDLVGPTIGADLRRKGVLATTTAVAGILAYIWFRFRFSFAVGAIAATVHDVLVTIIMLQWFNYELSLNIIAAILTITGYSVNDTIVIFDRVRENLRTSRREPLEQVVNTAVNQTLSRTIITAGTTFLAVFGLYLYGGELLEGMAFTLLVGIASGTYSTVFIASAIAILLSNKNGPATAPATQAQARARARRA